MKLVTPEISWHNRDPIYSLDFQYKHGHVMRLVTSGTDKNIRIWAVNEDNDGKVNIDFLSNLDRHSRAVNVVRFSPDGETLASAGDDSVIMLWKLQAASQAGGNLFTDDEGTENKENWTMQKILRGHLEDIYDLCWSADGSRMISGSVDNSAIIWDVKKGKPLSILKEASSFIQGVAWDPKEQYAATLSCDRRCRIYNLNNSQCIHSVHKMALPTPVATQQQQKQTIENNVENTNNNNNSTPSTKPRSFKMYHDDTMKSFFRRLSFSPDGEILITPAGLVELGEKEKPVDKNDDAKDDVIVVKDTTTKENSKLDVNATFLFSRTKFTKPAAYLPYPPKATVAVRCSPVLYQLREIPRKDVPADADPESLKPWEKYETIFCLPYRVVFAVATEDCVLVYDSQQTMPIVCISRIHYHQLSDLAWSEDGNTLGVASTDGYCSLVTFDKGELGTPYAPPVAVQENKAESMEVETTDDKNVKPALVIEPEFTSPEQDKETPKAVRVKKDDDGDADSLHLKLDDSADEMDTSTSSAVTESAAKSETKSENSTSISATTDVAAKTETKIENVTEKSGQDKSAEHKPRRIAFTTLSKPS